MRIKFTVSIVMFLSAFVIILACSDKDKIKSYQADAEKSIQKAICYPIIINDSLFNNVVSDTVIFSGIAIVDSCLRITIQYGGGCGDTEAKLITNSCVFETLPPQKDLFFAFSDLDSCESLITKEYCFDISSLKYTESNVLVLNVKNLGVQILYNY